MFEKTNNNLNNFQRSIKYIFKEINLLQNSLSHPSFVYENNLPHYKNNQRLEFLGDAVLGLIVSEIIYEKYPHLPEGNMTKVRAKVVKESTLARIAKEISLGEMLYLGKGEELTGGRSRSSTLADSLEALIGAIYIDGGLEDATYFIREHFYLEIDKTIRGQTFKDFKSTLQELIQKKCEKNYL